MASRGLELAENIFRDSEHFSKIIGTLEWMMDMLDSSRGKEFKWF